LKIFILQSTKFHVLNFIVLAVKKRYSWFLVLGKVDLNCITRLSYNEEVDIPLDITVDKNRIKAVERGLQLSSKVLFEQGLFQNE
jgi:hypothetical protein